MRNFGCVALVALGTGCGDTCGGGWFASDMCIDTIAPAPAETDLWADTDAPVDSNQPDDTETPDDTDSAAYTLLYTGPYDGGGSVSAVVNSEEEWAAILEAHPPYGPIVDVELDFETHQLLVAGHFVASTCALNLTEYEVTEVGDSVVHLQVQVTDTSGDCDEACDAEGSQMVIVLVGNDRTGSTGVELVNECE